MSQSATLVLHRRPMDRRIRLRRCLLLLLLPFVALMTQVVDAQVNNNTSTLPPTTVSPTTSPTPIPPQWSGCIDPLNPTRKVYKGEATVICLTLGPSGNWTDNGAPTVRFSFRPEADQYSQFTIPKCT